MLNSFPDPYDADYVDVRTLPDAEDVPAEVLAAYGVEGASVTRLTTGSFNIHFKVESSRGVFDLRRSNRPINRSNLLYEAEFLSRLHGKGFTAAPDPVATRDGDLNFWTGDSGWTLFNWVEEASGPPNLTVTEGRIDSAAQTLAAIHEATADFEPRSRRGDWPIFSKPEEWVARWAHRSDTLAQHLVDEGHVEDGEDLRRLSSLVTKQIAEVDFSLLQRFGCHGDYRMKNVRFQGDDVSTVFDFDIAMMSTRLFDLGGAVTRFSPMAGGTSAPQADVEPGARLLSVYDQSLPLTDYEWKVLPVFIRWRLIRDVNAYFDRWWLPVADTVRSLFNGAANEMVERARP